MLCVNIVATLRVAESMEDIPAEVMELMQISETIPGVTFFTAYGRIFVDWMSVNLPEVSVFQSAIENMNLFFLFFSVYISGLNK